MIGRWLGVAAALHALAAGAAAQGIVPLLDAGWLGFEAGFEPRPFGPVALAVGDIDRDGDLDVLTANDYFKGPGLAVLRNAGDGSFAAHDYYPIAVGEEPGAAALADLDGDGDLDAFATLPGFERLGTTLRVWRNEGTGRLGLVEDYTVGEAPQGLVVADLTGDGFPDAATADHGRLGRGTTISLLYHNGRAGALAGFLGARSLDVGPAPFRLIAGDLDGDGWTDLVCVRGDGMTGSTIAVLLNDRTGGFPGPYPEVPAGRSYKPVVGLADLDGDGDLDLVSSEPDAAGDTVVVRRNDGRGGFGAPASTPLGLWSPTTLGFAFADVDADGSTDVLTANPDGRSFEGIRVLRNDGRGGLLAAERYETAQNTETLAAFDADADGDIDIVSLAHSSATLAVHRNPGSGVFPRTTRFPTVSFPRGLEAADLDGDLDVDLALADTSRLHLHFNDGQGGFGPARSSRPAVTPGGFRLVDLDGDGLADLLVPTQGVFVARNLGGGFDAGATFPVGTCNEIVEAGDLDGDLDPDLVAADCAFPYLLHLLRNEGGLRFTGAGSIPTTLPAERILIADTNRDGLADIVAGQGGYGVSTFLGAGSLAFGPALTSLDALPPGLMAIHDFDQDGTPDLAVQIRADAFGTDRIGIAPGRGDGTFASPVLRFGSSALEILAIGVDLDLADLNCDGLQDVVVTSYASNDLGVFLSRGDGSLEPEVRYGPGLTPQQTALADFTGDGTIDAATTIHAGGTTCCEEAVAVLRGLCGCALPDLVPPDQGNVLRATHDASDVELVWTGTGTSRWRVFRDDRKSALGRTALGPDATLEAFADAGALARGGIDFYRVKGLSPCSLSPGP